MNEYTFNLDAPIENLDGVPSDLKPFFEQSDDGYRVAESYVPVAKRLNGLAGNLKDAMSKRTQAGKDAGAARELANGYAALFASDGLDEVNPETVAAHLTDLRARAAKGGKDGKAAAEEIERIKAEMKSAHAKELTGKDEVISKQASQINQLVRGQQISDAMVKHKVVGGEVLKVFLEQRIQVRESDDGALRAVVVDDKGEIRYNGEGNPMTVDQYVDNLKSQDEYASFFESKKVPGHETQHQQQRQQQQKQQNEVVNPMNRISQGLSNRKKSGNWAGRS